jgi:hypothetical protein
LEKGAEAYPGPSVSPLQEATATALGGAEQKLAEAIGSGGLQQKVTEYYQSLLPQLQRQYAQTAEQFGMAPGGRHSSGVLQALGNVTGDYYSNYLAALANAAQAELTAIPQALAGLATPATKVGEDIWAQPYQEWVRQAEYPMRLMTPAAALLGAMRPTKQKSRSKSEAETGGCCFIFIEAANGTLDPVVRRYRDEHLTVRNRRGYYWLSDRLVPLMRKWRFLKEVVRKVMTQPMTAYGRYVYGGPRSGALFAPVAAAWLLVFRILGLRPPYRRHSTGEVV